MVTDIEVLQGGSTSEFAAITFGFYTPTGTSDDYFAAIGLIAEVELLYSAHTQWEGRLAIPELTFLGAQNEDVLGAPNLAVTGYQLSLP